MNDLQKFAADSSQIFLSHAIPLAVPCFSTLVAGLEGNDVREISN